MTTLTNPPLIEAIFELRWGEITQEQYSYTPEERSLFAGKISAAMAAHGFVITELVQQQLPFILPMQVTHRFRMQSNSYPCFQVGLGIFTANQIKEGYDWDSFKQSIKTGLDIYNKAEVGKLDSIKDTLTLSLRYQDAFFPENNISTEAYLKNHFNINAGLSEGFLGSPDINRSKSSVDISVRLDTIKPIGIMDIIIGNAIIDDKPGLLMNTIVSSKAIEGLSESIDINIIMAWLEQAHNLQRHSFDTLVNRSAYE